jgi:hypothetical protein
MTGLASFTRVSIAIVDSNGATVASCEHGPVAGWVPLNCADNRILWVHGTGRISLWQLGAKGERTGGIEHGPFGGWTPVNYADDHILWRSADHRVSLWWIDAQGKQLGYKEHGPHAGWTPVHYSDGQLLWRHTDGRASLWQVGANGERTGGIEHGPYSGWSPILYHDGHLLWRHLDGRASLWRVDAQGKHLSYTEHTNPGYMPVDYHDGCLLWRSAAGASSLWTLDERDARLRVRELAGGDVLLVQRAALVLQTNIGAAAGATSGAQLGPQLGVQLKHITVEGRIAEAWQATGAESGPLGAAKGVATLAEDGETLAQKFTGGGITDHPALGTAVIRSAKLFGDWHRQAALLGPPRRADTPASAVQLRCERGDLICSSGGVAHAVVGATLLCHRRHGGVAKVGRPTGASAVLGAGFTAQRFESGDILESAEQAFYLPEAFASAWSARGGALGFLGLPVADLSPYPRGSVLRFSGGTLVGSPAGVVGLPTRWMDEWVVRLGGPNGSHGAPVSDVQRSPAGAEWVDFERGCLVLTAAKLWFAPRGLAVRLGRVASYGDDGASGNIDLYVHASIGASIGEPFQERLPATGTFGADAAVDRDLLTIPVARGGLRLELEFAGWDCDKNNLGGGDDDHLGTIHHVLTVDNLWGSDSPGLHRDRGFSAEYAVKLDLVYDPAKFRENLSWRFRNFSTDDITYTQFARAFADVETDETTGWNLFHHIFYELAVRNMAESGNCLGMCLESIAAQLGASLYTPPLSQFGPPPTAKNECQKPAPGSDDLLIDQINVRHCLQVGGEAMREYLRRSIDQNDCSGPALFELSKSLHDTNQRPLIGVYADSLFSRGHIVRPYAWAPDGSYIRVANPNAPHPQSGDDHAWNTITIDKASGHWTLDERAGSSGTLYTNNKATNGGRGLDRLLALGADDGWGRVVVVPSAAWLTEQTVPSSAEQLHLLGLFLALAVGSADLEQVTDEGGRTLFAENLGRAASRWRDLRTGTGRIPELLPMPPLGGANLASPMLVGRARPQSLSYRLVGRGGPARFAQFSGRLAAVVAYDALAAQRDELTIRSGGPEGPGLRFSAGGASAAEITLGANRRAWRLRGLTPGAAAPVEVFVRGGGSELEVRSAAPVAFDLDRLAGKSFVACGDRNDLRVTANQALVIREGATNVLSAALINRATLTPLRTWTF